MTGRGIYLVTGLAVALAGALLVLEQTPASAQNAKISAVVMDVTHRVGAGGSFVKSTVGAQLPPGSRVRTGRRSKCEIKFPSGSVIRMGERTDLVIQQGTSAQLGYGRVYAKIIAGTAATISGATATAAVKGTELEFIGIGEDEQDLPPNQRHEVLRVYAGEVLLLNEAGERTLTAGMATQVFGGHQPAPPVSTPPQQFPGGQRTQWFGGVQEGVEVQSALGSDVAVEIQQQRMTTTTVATTVIPPPEEGSVEVVVSGVKGGWGPGAMDLLGLATRGPVYSPDYERTLASLPLGTLTTGAASSAVTAQLSGGVDIFGKQFFGPDYSLDLFGFWAEGAGFVGALPRTTAVWGDVYLEASALVASDFHGSIVEFADCYAAIRPSWGEVVAGRQRFLDGPVNNTPVGTLLPFDVADAVRVDYNVDGRLKLTGAYLDDWTPLIGPDTNGLFMRAQYPVLGGTAGVSWLHQSDGDQEGWMAELAVPVLPGDADTYVQIGSDPEGRDLGTAGVYLPWLYRKHQVDLFAEYAWRDGLPDVVSLRAYRSSENWDAVLMTQTEVNGPTAVGIGAVVHFGQ